MCSLTPLRSVERLLGKAEEAAPLPDLRDGFDQASGSEGPGDQINGYRLLEPLGEGGFGTVYLAEQQEPVHRQVALKVVKLGMDTKRAPPSAAGLAV